MKGQFSLAATALACADVSRTIVKPIVDAVAFAIQTVIDMITFTIETVVDAITFAIEFVCQLHITMSISYVRSAV
jgi:hypothetical protein